MTHKQSLVITLICSALALGAAWMWGCEKPDDAPGHDEAPTHTPSPSAAPAGDPPYVQRAQERYWDIDLHWHHQSGWTVTVKEDTGGIASDVRRAQGRTIAEALKGVE